MSIASKLQALLEQKILAVSWQDYSPEQIARVTGDLPETLGDRWLVPCRHQLSPPATRSELQETERAMCITLPENLRQFLELSNGARLYIVSVYWLRSGPDIVEHTRYHILSASELIQVNYGLLKCFREVLGNDADFASMDRLNYLAFCDAHNGNYLAIIMEGPEAGKVFFLDHEGFFRPYSELDTDIYYMVAPSFEEWLDLVIEEHGWRGFGEDVPGI